MARVPKVKYKINLDELFGSSLDYSSSTKQAVGQAVIDRIVERTQEKRIDKFGKRMAGYSKSYANSLAGQVGGKSPGQSANLTLSGDMLGSLTIIDQTAKTITIGFDDSTENAKAYGHISGMEGHPTIKKGKVRDFLGLPQTELNAIANEFVEDVARESQIRGTEDRDEFNRRVLSLIEELTAENEGG